MANKNSKNQHSKSETRNQIAARIKAKMDHLLKEIREHRRPEKECLDSLRDETRPTVSEPTG